MLPSTVSVFNPNQEKNFRNKHLQRERKEEKKDTITSNKLY
jgi:hypothetical protein